MKDTARLIMFLDCNLTCPYCCNKRDEVFSQFKRKRLEEIDFTPYKNICVTGGEPFYKKYTLYQTLSRLPKDKTVYLYSNGLLIDSVDITIIQTHFPNVKGINIGLHSIEQVRSVRDIEHKMPVRFLINDELKEQFIMANPGRLNEKNCSTWHMNNCDRSNEDWYFLNL